MANSGPIRVATALRVLALAWSAYLGVLVCAFYFQRWHVQRNHLDSAWLIEAALVAVAVILRRNHGASHAGDAHVGISGVLAFVAIGQIAAFTLYLPTLRAGLLADDFTLLRRASDGVFASFGDMFFRPLPLALWAGIERLVPVPLVPFAMHALNISLHGLNAVVTQALGRRLGLRSGAAAMAGVAFLCFPAHVEAVGWCSGIQDILMTTGVLGFLVLMTGPISLLASLAALLSLLVALASKEAAVSAVLIAPLFLMLPGGSFRSIWRVWLSACAVTASYATWRVWEIGRRLDNGISTTHRGIEHFITSPFAALGSPWMDVDIHRWPLLGLMPCLLILVSIVVVVWQRLEGPTIARFVVLLACVLLAIAPVGRYFYVAPDLQGARYLYLPAVFWCLFLASLVEGIAANGRHWIPVCCLAVVASMWVVGTRLHQAPWREAGQERDRLLAAIKGKVTDGCREVVIDAIPDNVNGAYVFRNGLPDALVLERIGATIGSRGSASSGCRVSVGGAR